MIVWSVVKVTCKGQTCSLKFHSTARVIHGQVFSICYCGIQTKIYVIVCDFDRSCVVVG